MSMFRVSAIVLAIVAVTGCTFDNHTDTKPVMMVNGKLVTVNTVKTSSNTNTSNTTNNSSANKGSSSTNTSGSTNTSSSANTSSNTNTNTSSNSSSTSSGSNNGSSSTNQGSTTQNSNITIAPHTVSYAALKKNVESELRAYAKNEGVSFGSLDSYSITAKGKTYTGDINLRDFGKGLQQFEVVENASVTAGGQKFTATRNNTALLYQQDYSVVGGFINKSSVIKDARGKTVDLDNDIDEYSVHLAGTPTQTLPSNVKATYVGKAFTADDNYQMVQGELNYTVDFGAKTGSGKITSNAGNITLNEGNIAQSSYTSELDGSKLSGYGISGTASSSQLGSGTYGLGFFGANAEEIAGTAEFTNKEVGFGGKKQ